MSTIVIRPDDVGVTNCRTCKHSGDNRKGYLYRCALFVPDSHSLKNVYVDVRKVGDCSHYEKINENNS